MGFGELVLVLVIVVVLFGATRLPALGEGLGKAIKGFKGAIAPDEKPRDGGAAPKPPDRDGP